MSEADQPDDSGVSLSKLDQSALSETTPLVFQCSQCNTIVGDSLSWVSADKVMRTIALACMYQRYLRSGLKVAASNTSYNLIPQNRRCRNHHLSTFRPPYQEMTF